MNTNIGKTDKWVRLAVAAIIAVLYFSHTISGVLALVLGVVAIILALTATFNFCPLYRVFNINTCEKK